MSNNLPKIILDIASLAGCNKLENQEFLIFNAIDQDVDNIKYLVGLAITCAQNGRLDEATLILNCLSSKVDDQIKIFYNLGLVHSLSGNHQDAIKAYDLALKLDPNDVDTLVNKSSILNELQEYQTALIVSDEAIKSNPQIPEAWINRGNSLCNLNRFEESILAYKEAHKLNPFLLEAQLNQILPLNKLGRYSEALALCDEAIRLDPLSQKAYFNKAITLNELGQFNQALMLFDKAIYLNSNLAENYFGKGVSLYKLNRPFEALSEYDKAITLNSNFAEAFYHKGIALSKTKFYEEAIVQFNKAISIDRNKPDYWFSMGAAHLELSQPLEAISHFQKALDLNANFHVARWAKAFAYIPSIQSESDDVEFLRNKFLNELKLFNDFADEKKLADMHKVVGIYQPFYLAYHNFNNKQILSEYGLICEKFMRHWQLINKVSASKKMVSRKIKIGIVSAHIYDHSVWHAIIKGLLINLDPNKFDVHIFYLGAVFDDETNLAKLHAASFSSGEPSLSSWVQLICNKNIEVLIFPEIGMHQLTTQLANLRLCDLQIAAWGHPETTGLPNIDYYLSGDLYEPECIDAYTETLIKLPNLASCYYRIEVKASEPIFDGIIFDSETPILLCPGTPFKYDPQNDWILVEIAKRLGKCKLVFFHHQEDLSQKLKLRLKVKFDAADLLIDEFIVFIPWLDSKQFYGLMSKANVYLDTIGFSGFNTAIQAIDCTLPIVTKEGRFMRGRLATGLLKRIGLSQLVATSDHEYIELAIKLVQDNKFSGQVRKKMLEMKPLLYEDTDVVRSLEAFLLGKLRSSPQKTPT